MAFPVTSSAIAPTAPTDHPAISTEEDLPVCINKIIAIILAVSIPVLFVPRLVGQNMVSVTVFQERDAPRLVKLIELQNMRDMKELGCAVVFTALLVGGLATGIFRGRAAKCVAIANIGLCIYMGAQRASTLYHNN